MRPRFINVLKHSPIGGPGGSDIQFIQELAPYFRGPQYDLVGFDLRGERSEVSLTTITDNPVQA